MWSANRLVKRLNPHCGASGDAHVIDARKLSLNHQTSFTDSLPSSRKARDGAAGALPGRFHCSSNSGAASRYCQQSAADERSVRYSRTPPPFSRSLLPTPCRIRSHDKWRLSPSGDTRRPTTAAKVSLNSLRADPPGHSYLDRNQAMERWCRSWRGEDKYCSATIPKAARLRVLG